MLSVGVVLYPYTAERKDVLENTLPEAQEISQGRGFCTPRPENHEGNLEGRGVKHPHPREISMAKVDVFSNVSRLVAVYRHSFRISREVLILLCDNIWLWHQ